MSSSLVGNLLTPLEQVDNLLADFVEGAPLTFSRQFKPLRPLNQHSIWEFKTDDTRIFGWFPSKDHFIATNGANADAVKDTNLYGFLIKEAVDTRKRLGLHDAFITSASEHDVLSNRSPRQGQSR